MAATDARPIPKKNTAFRIPDISFDDASGDLITSWTGISATKSLDGATFTACTNAPVEIGTSGIGYLDLTAAEMNVDSVIVYITITNTGSTYYKITLLPEESGDIRATTTGDGSSPLLIQKTTIATLASQTSFTLTDGSTDDDSYNGLTAIITDAATSTQKAVAHISDYTGATKTITLRADPGVFTMAELDTIDIVAVNSKGVIDANMITTSLTATEIADITTNGQITRRRGNTWTIPITGLGNLAGRSSLWFAVKDHEDDVDERSIVYVEETAQLQYIAKGTATTASNASITVDDESAGDITIVIKAVETAKVKPTSTAVYEVQWKATADGAITTPESGTFTINADVIRAT